MDANHFKKILEVEKEKLNKEIGFYKNEDPYLDKYRSTETFDDSVTEIEGHDRIAATKTELEVSLKDTNEALKRIEDGKFGKCLNCGQEISPERLEAIPTASYCTSCQAKKNRA